MNQCLMDEKKKIVIWGASNRAHRFMMDYCISEEKVAFLVDRKKGVQDEGFVYMVGKEKKKVYSPHVLDELSVEDYIWVITVGQPEDIVEELKSKGGGKTACLSIRRASL